MFYIIIYLQTFFGNLTPRDFAIFVLDVALQGLAEGGITDDGEDFVGEFALVPKIVFHGRPDDFGDARLLGEDEAVAMVGGLEGGETKWLGNGAHNENV